MHSVLSTGVNEADLNTQNVRICGSTTSSFLETFWKPNSIFDCPEQSQTSPTTTLVNVRVFSPLTTRLSPTELALSVGSRTSHLPSAPAVVSALRLPKETVIFSPAFAKPQTGTGMPCWSTMLWPNRPEVETSAQVGDSEAEMKRLIIADFCRHIFII